MRSALPGPNTAQEGGQGNQPQRSASVAKTSGKYTHLPVRGKEEEINTVRPFPPVEIS